MNNCQPLSGTNSKIQVQKPNPKPDILYGKSCCNYNESEPDGEVDSGNEAEYYQCTKVTPDIARCLFKNTKKKQKFPTTVSPKRKVYAPRRQRKKISEEQPPVQLPYWVLCKMLSMEMKCENARKKAIKQYKKQFQRSGHCEYCNPMVHRFVAGRQNNMPNGINCNADYDNYNEMPSCSFHSTQMKSNLSKSVSSMDPKQEMMQAELLYINEELGHYKENLNYLKSCLNRKYAEHINVQNSLKSHCSKYYDG